MVWMREDICNTNLVLQNVACGDCLCLVRNINTEDMSSILDVITMKLLQYCLNISATTKCTCHLGNLPVTNVVPHFHSTDDQRPAGSRFTNELRNTSSSSITNYLLFETASNPRSDMEKVQTERSGIYFLNMFFLKCFWAHCCIFLRY